MKKTKTFLAIITLFAVALSPAFLAYADSGTPTASADTSSASVATPNVASVDAGTVTITASSDAGDPTATPDMATELTELQAKQQDPNLGFFTKLWISLKIKEIQNQIRVQDAVQ